MTDIFRRFFAKGVVMTVFFCPSGKWRVGNPRYDFSPLREIATPLQATARNDGVKKEIATLAAW